MLSEYIDRAMQHAHYEKTETGNYYDDTKRYIEASKILSDEDRFQIYEGNARRVFPRLDAALKRKGK